MRLISKGPVKVRSVKKFSNVCGCSGIDGFSSLDGSSPKSDILDFQKYAESKGAKLVKGWKSKSTGHVFKVGDAFVIDGSWGANSQAAWDIYGKDWEAAKLAAAQEAPPGKPRADDKPAANDAPKTDDPKKDNKPVKLMDKWKALSTTKKGLVIGGGSLLTIGLVILIWKLVIPKK